MDSDDEVFLQDEYVGEDAAKHFLDQLPHYEKLSKKENKSSEMFTKSKLVHGNGKCIEKGLFVIFAVSSFKMDLGITEKFWIMIM